MDEKLVVWLEYLSVVSMVVEWVVQKVELLVIPKVGE